MSSIQQKPTAIDPHAVLLFSVPFMLVLGLSLEGGGFDPVLFGEVGVIVWWSAMLCAIAGVAALGRLSAGAWAVLGAMAAFVAWTGLSMLWSESAGRSGLELARASSYLAVLALTLTVAPHRRRRTLILAGVAAAIGLVAVIALLARMEPEVFPRNDTIDVVGAALGRLNYPLNYWNGLAGLIAIGIPLIARFAVAGRSGAVRALASGALPAALLAIYLTLSRGGALAAACGLLLLAALYPLRLRLLGQLLVAGAGVGVLVWAAEAREEFMDGVRSGAGLTQGDELLVFLIVVCGLATLWPRVSDRLGRELAARGGSRRIALPSRRAKIGAAALAGVVALTAALAVGAPERISDRWQEFKDPSVAADAGRLASASGNGRYQWWEAAVDAGASEPLLGIGAGTFGFWWSREAEFPSQVVDAHSLYLESFAELGAMGLVLILAVVGGSLMLIVVACVRRRRGSAAGRGRADLAAAAGSVMAFAVAAGIDWAWESPALPVAALLVVGAALGQRPAGSLATGFRPRVALIAAALLGVLAIAPALLGLDAVRASQAHFRAGDLDAALDDAERARAFEPWSATGAVQEAIVLEKIGDLRGAVVSAREATEKEPTNWANWFVLMRFERILGEHPGASEAAREEAERLNPYSPLFR